MVTSESNNQLTRTQIWDINAPFFGVSVSRLMETAGKQVAEAVMSQGNDFLVLVGPGNNGGDALVAARYLFQMGRPVQVCLTKPADKIDNSLWRENFNKLNSLIPPELWINEIPEKLDSKTIIIDGIFGSGFEGDWRKSYLSFKTWIESKPNPVVAIDVPSGWPDEPLRVTGILALEEAQPGLKDYAADQKINLKELPIGIPEEARTGVGPAQMRMYWPQRQAEGHKGDHGHLTIIGGSEMFFGAPITAAWGAIRSGVDLIEVYTSPAYLHLAEKVLPELIVRPYAEPSLTRQNLGAIKESLSRSSAVLIGPGFMPEDTEDFSELLREVISLIDPEKTGLVIDGGGLLDLTDYPRHRNWLLTPHGGEWRRLTQSLSKTEPGSVARKFQVNLLLKGETDIIVGSGGDTIHNYTGNAVLTKGGTGDLLAGLAAGLMAQGLTGYQAGQLAAFCLGVAGDEIKKTYSSSFTLSELSATLASVINHYA